MAKKTISINIKGLDKLRRSVANFPSIAAPIASKAINRTIFAIEERAVPLTPVRTGQLRRSYVSGRTLSTPATLTGQVGSKLEYAPFVHFGTKPSPGRFVPAIGRRLINPANPSFGFHPGQKANPFLQKGIDAAEPRINRIFADAITDIAKRTVGQ